MGNKCGSKIYDESRSQGPNVKSMISKFGAWTSGVSSSTADFLGGDGIALDAGQWCCESALWTSHVVHFGSLFATTEGKIFAVDAEKFAQTTLAHRHVAKVGTRYALEFVQLL